MKRFAFVLKLTNNNQIFKINFEVRCKINSFSIFCICILYLYLMKMFLLLKILQEKFQFIAIYTEMFKIHCPISKIMTNSFTFPVCFYINEIRCP